jgi:high-affinity Fe2+/Pb2+ permease
MGLRSTWQNNQQVRRGVMGAIAGMVAGITAAGLDGSLFYRYGVAIFLGIVVFVALKLLLD